MRIVSATNRDLIADVKSGRFREDLFYRLHVFPLTVPPLRERGADIPALARHFLARFAAEEGKRIRGIAPEALRLLAAFAWPGNIRQLENALFRAVVLADGDSVGLAEFPQIAAQVHHPAPAADSAAADSASPPQFAQTEESGEADLFAAELAHEPPLSPAEPAAPLDGFVDSLPLLDDAGEVRTLEEMEADLIRFAITHYSGQMSEVARRLRIGRSTLYRKLESLGLSEGAPSGRGTETDEGEAGAEGVAAERQPRKIA